MNRASAKDIFCNNILKKITLYINNELKGDYESFKTQYPNLQTFSQSFHLDNIISHQFSFNNEDYSIILNYLDTYYSTIKESRNKDENTISKPKIKQKLPKEKTIAGFVDILIISFIAGSFIGIILLNIYSKIAEHI